MKMKILIGDRVQLKSGQIGDVVNTFARRFAIRWPDGSYSDHLLSEISPTIPDPAHWHRDTDGKLRWCTWIEMGDVTVRIGGREHRLTEASRRRLLSLPDLVVLCPWMRHCTWGSFCWWR